MSAEQPLSLDAETPRAHRPGVSPQRFVLAALAVLALIASFAIGRATAPDSATPTANCQGDIRNGINTPAAFAGPQQLGYFSRCEERLAQQQVEFGEHWNKINIYADQTSDKVIAWFYSDCGMPEGIVAVGTDRPSICGVGDTTAAA